MTISTSSALSIVELFHFYQLCLLMSGHHHLCDTLTGVDHEGRVREIDKQDANLAAVVRIDGTGRIEHRDAVLEGKT